MLFYKFRLVGAPSRKKVIFFIFIVFFFFLNMRENKGEVSDNEEIDPKILLFSNFSGIIFFAVIQRKIIRN